MSDTSKKRKDGTTAPFDEGDMVLYIPEHLLMGDRELMVQHENLGVVSSKNDMSVFVQFIGKETPQGVRPVDLYFIHHKPDLEQVIIEDLKKRNG